MATWNYSVLIGLGTARVEGYCESRESARDGALKYSRITSLIVRVTSPEGRTTDAFEEGEEIALDRAEIFSRLGYTPEAVAAWAEFHDAETGGPELRAAEAFEQDNPVEY
jgi:hypothetical protein